MDKAAIIEFKTDAMLVHKLGIIYQTIQCGVEDKVDDLGRRAGARTSFVGGACQTC